LTIPSASIAFLTSRSLGGLLDLVSYPAGQLDQTGRHAHAGGCQAPGQQDPFGARTAFQTMLRLLKPDRLCHSRRPILLVERMLRFLSINPTDGIGLSRAPRLGEMGIVKLSCYLPDFDDE
jgi:hypothetical protein